VALKTLFKTRGSFMDKLGRLHRIMLGRAFTLGMLFTALVVLVPITVNEVRDWFVRFEREANTIEGEDLLLAFPGQAPIGVILVALGVVLEGRHTFLRKVLKLYRLQELPGQEVFCDHCELFGFYLLILGLVIECFSELTKFIGLNNHLALLGFGGASLLLNAVAVLFLLQLSTRVARLRLTDAPAASNTKELVRE
jgi:hypothetical protein